MIDPQQQQQRPGVDQFLPVLFALRTIKKHRTTAPTNVPKNFLEQVEFYDDGTTRKVYFYINNTWRSVTVS